MLSTLCRKPACVFRWMVLIVCTATALSLQAQTTTDYTISRGGHTVSVVQLTGFNGTPNEYEATAIIEGCDVDVFTFP